MAEKLSISIPEDDKELLEWVDEKVEEGAFQGRSHGIRRCIQIVKEDDRREVVV